MTLVDSNVLIDLLQDDPQWGAWSEQQLFAALRSGPLFINPIGYAELVPSHHSMLELDAFLAQSSIAVKPLSRQTAFVAGEAFLKYRRRRSSKTGVLADFFIGAQAQTEAWPLLTRDASRYKTYFPSVKLICP
jgi:predicted nucleic acid-binding protein